MYSQGRVRRRGRGPHKAAVVVVVVPPLTRGGGIVLSLAFAVSVWRLSTIKLSAHPQPSSPIPAYYTGKYPSQSMRNYFAHFRPLFPLAESKNTTLELSRPVKPQTTKSVPPGLKSGFWGVLNKQFRNIQIQPCSLRFPCSNLEKKCWRSLQWWVCNSAVKL